VSEGRKRLLAVALVVPLVAVVAWVIWSGQRQHEDSTEVLRALRASQGPVLPEARAAGASSRTDPARYEAGSLYELIDGAADAYVARGFTSCVSASFTFPGTSGSQLEIAAEVHRFRDPGGAKGQLEAERPPTAAPVPGHPGAFAEPSVLLATKGADFLKLTVLTSSPAAGEAMLALIGAWEKETP
jgi:hypothetical protein